MTPKGKKGLKEIWKRDEEDPNLINLTNQNGDIDDEVLILDSILTARIHPHRLHPSELVEGKDFSILRMDSGTYGPYVLLRPPFKVTGAAENCFWSRIRNIKGS